MHPRKRKRSPSLPSESSRLKQSKSERCYFLELPLEIRQKVYQQFFDSHDLPRICIKPCRLGCPYHRVEACSILATCRQVHSEAWSFFASYCTFVADRPLRLANNFLSFLPGQRLLSIKHLTLRVMHDDPSVARDFQRVWWHYLDVFTNLDSLTVETITPYGITFLSCKSFYDMIGIVVGLMEQRNPKDARWVGKKMHTRLRINSDKITASHEWVLDVAAALSYDRVSESQIPEEGTIHRIILRQHNGLINANNVYHISEHLQNHVSALDHPPPEFLFKMFQHWSRGSQWQTVLFNVCHDVRPGESGGSVTLLGDFSLVGGSFVHTMITQFQLGTSTLGYDAMTVRDHILNDYHSSTRMLRIAGYWNSTKSDD